MFMESFKCPACELKYDTYPYQEICRCGIQFGYTDTAGNSDEKQKKLYELWRAQWLENNRQKLTKDQQQAIWSIINTKI